MRDKVFKVKRRHVDWYEVYLYCGIPEVCVHFFELRKRHPNMSLNRCAYYALKTYYSTTAMTRYRWTGSFL